MILAVPDYGMPRVSESPAPPPGGPAAVVRLRRLSMIVVALALLTAGGWKVYRPDTGLTMLSRTLPSPKAVRAAACLEIALALWLLSGKSPKLAPATAAAAFIATGCLIAGELRRDHPLPCGCFPIRPVSTDSATIRHELTLALGRNAFLILLCGITISLTHSPAFSTPPTLFERRV